MHTQCRRTSSPPWHKNVVNSGVELKRTFYMYLVHHTEEKQEIALLSIKSLQK